MILKEEKKDLFSVSPDHFLMHCVSADFALGAGIAKTFKDIGVRDILLQLYPQNRWNGEGYCLYTPVADYRGVLNLVTKDKYWHKPTYGTLAEALVQAHRYLSNNTSGAVKLAMPQIGCGLDKLEWPLVKYLITKEFNNKDIEILVCSL